MPEPVQVQILIDIKARLDELAKTQAKFRETKEEAEGFGSLLAQGLGIGTGMELARRGIDMFKEALLGGVDAAYQLAREIKQNAADIGFSGESYQVFKNELHESGLEMGRLTMAVAHQTDSLNAARQGAGAAYDAYKDLHLVASQIEALPADQRILAIAKATLGAADQTRAFAAAGTILGQRGLPSLLGSLKNLTTEGYAKLSEEMIKSGKIMDDQTAELLRRNEKQMEALKLQRTVATGEILGFYTLLAKAAADNPLGLLKSVFSFDSNGPKGTASFLADYLPPDVPDNTPKPSSKPRPEAIAIAKLQDLQEQTGEVQNNQLITETNRRSQLIDLLEKQAKLYEELQSIKFRDSGELAAKLKTGEITQEELSRYEQYVALTVKMTDTWSKLAALKTVHSEAWKTNEEYKVFSSGKNAEGGALLSPGQGMMAGMQTWSMSLGSIGQQISGTVGSELSSVSQELTGIITKTKTWGDVGRAAGNMLLQMLVQIGLQQLVNLAITMLTTEAGSAARKKELGENALVAGFKALAQLGPIWGTLAFAAAAAAIVGLAGGFREQGGPVSAGVPYIVGERRAEVFVPNVSGTIVPSIDQYRFSGGALAAGGASAGGGSGGGSAPMTGRQERLLVYVDSQETLDRLGRDPRFENKIVDIGKRRRGEIFSV